MTNYPPAAGPGPTDSPSRRLSLTATAAQWQAFGEHLRTIPAFKGDDLVEVLDVDGGGIRFRYSIVDTVPAPSPFATGGLVRGAASPDTEPTPAAALHAARGSVAYLDRVENRCMHLGELQDALELCPDDEPVLFSVLTPAVEGEDTVAYATPVEIESWRGDYAQLAITRAFAGDYPRPTTAGDLLEKVNELLAGKEYQGYKGGTYTAWASTYVNVAQWGESGTLELRGVSRGRDYRLEGDPMTTWLHVVDTKAEADDDESEG